MLKELLGLAGVALVALSLQDAFEVVLLPRQVHRRVRIMRLFFALTWRGWRAAGAPRNPSSPPAPSSPHHPFAEALRAYLDRHLALDLFHPGVRVLKIAGDGFSLAEGRVKLFRPASPAARKLARP